MTHRLRVLFFMTGGTIAILGISVSASDAGPITCAGFGGSVKGAPTAKLNGALSCTGTGQQGQAGPGQDSPTHLNGLGAYGAGWELVAGVPGTTEAFDGSYHLDPAAFQCAGGACKHSAVARSTCA